MDIPATHINICNGCRERIAFVKCPGKKKGEHTWVPVDITPSDSGTYLVEPDPTSDRPALRGGPIDKAGIRAGMRANGITLHTSHFKTCPKADEFRRNRKPLVTRNPAYDQQSPTRGAANTAHDRCTRRW